MTAIDQDRTWPRLHDVRLRGMTEAENDPEVEQLIDAGYLLRRGSRVVITPAGKAAHAEWAQLAEGSEEYAAARRAYDHFLVFDKQIKELTTAWQMAAAGSRAEGFSADDWTLIDRLTGVHEKAGAPLGSLGRAVPRFAGYRPRLRHALQQLEEGDPKWFSGLTCDSYHTVWWQLHEDLLIALGISRSDDPNQ
ncbi:MAG TPA: hypothetical protein VG034_14695 [Acidimicrobiia bacterium]|nr:hypothetical protein [Acidimicrobiia bacterium]